MLNPKLTIGVVAVACLLTGWFAGSYGLSVEAQRETDFRRTITRVIPPPRTSEVSAIFREPLYSGDVVLKIPSDTGEYTMLCTIGLQVATRSGIVVWEEDPSEVQDTYEHLLNFGILFEDEDGEHFFTGKGFRKQVLQAVRRVLLGGIR